MIATPSSALSPSGILDSKGHPVTSTPAPVITRRRVAASTARIGTLGEAFGAARRDGYRGMFWFGSLDPKDQMPQMTRQTIAEKANWAYNHIGAVRVVIDGLALDEVDTGLWPKPATGSVPFNAKLKVLWNQQCGFHKSFSADGENNFYSAQYLIRREIRLRGALFGMKLRAGEAASCPQMHFVPDWQAQNANTRLDQSLWQDGRRDNKFGRALQWRFVTDPADRSKFLDVSAGDVTHFHDPFLAGQKRGISCLAPVVEKFFKIDEIFNAETSGVLLRSRVAYAIEHAAGSDDEGPSLLPGAVEVEEVENPDGTKLIIQKIVVGDNSEVEVADLHSGKKLKVIESAKSSEAASWTKELLTDVAYATLYPPQYIFSLAGLTQGTLVRLHQQKVQRVVNTIRDFQLIMQLLEEWWPFWVWQNIAGGRFDDVRGGIPDDWYSYLVVRPKDGTVDAGREGRLYDERVATGKMPFGLYVGMLYGEDDEDFEDQIIREAYRRRRRIAEIATELGEQPLALEEIFRPPAGTAAPPDPHAEPDDDEEKEDPDDEEDEKNKK